jgi:hypothetical protein
MKLPKIRMEPMQYEIRNQRGEVIGMAMSTEIANVFAQALREKDREQDYTVHPV